MKKLKTRAAAVMIHNRQILLIHRLNKGREYWVLPGGKVETNETIKEAVAREVMEETSLTATPTQLLYILRPKPSFQEYYYLCTTTGGKPSLGNFNEAASQKKGADFYNPQWVSLKKLPQLTLYPNTIKSRILLDFASSQ